MCEDIDDRQYAFNFSLNSPMTNEELLRVRRSISKRWKGMACRASYQEMNEAVGQALRLSNLSVDEKREFAINVANSLHDRFRPVARDMSVDHICRVAGVPFDRTESALYFADRYPFI